MTELRVLVAMDVLADSRVTDGWLKLARRRLRNRYAGGGVSAEFGADSVYRVGIDAVAVLPWRRGDAGVEVLLREFLRPGIDLRARLDAPFEDAWRPLPLLWEMCAGIPEADESNLEAFPRCAARELAEEMGLAAEVSAIVSLGAATYPSAGILTEMIHLYAVEIAAGVSRSPIDGDGTPFEEAGRIRWWGLEEALAACLTGELADAKTEIALRRLAATLTG